MSKTEVPVTPEVLRWAIDESGYSLEELAAAAKLDSDDLKAWLKGDGRPGVTEVRALARTLRRQFAVFLLPRPPATKHREVRFRHLPGAAVRSLTPVERRYVRKAERLQRMLAWLADEMQERVPRLPHDSVDEDPVDTASAFRATLGIDDKIQRGWTSASMAFDAWREAVEAKGVTVFLFQMGDESCRGFSLWDDRAPVIAVNTAWNDEARAFTLFHELGHLITKTNSACVAAPPSAMQGAWDPAERWCERFAAAVLIPADTLKAAVAERLPGAPKRIADVASVKRLANWFHVSLRAVTLRLIEMGMANWDLYRELPAVGDAKRRGGPPGKGRDRQEIQEDQLGGRVMKIFRRAVERDVVTLSQALSYVDVPDTVFDPSNASA